MSKVKSKKNLEYYLNLPYTITLKKDPHGGFFVQVEELKGCVSQGETAAEATEMIMDAMKVWIKVALAENETIPEPREDYSGKFLVRLPKSLHRDLDLAAKKEGVSLNLFVVQLLSGEYSNACASKSFGSLVAKLAPYRSDQSSTSWKGATAVPDTEFPDFAMAN